MECAGNGSRTPCSGPARRHCNRCRAVAYCSLSHQVSHWSVHRRECERLEQQMKRADVLSDFPFTFTQFQETRCSFLERHGLHCVGMWACECSCGVSAVSFHESRLNHGWDLLAELCPCRGPSGAKTEHITSWKEYYEWRCIPLSSPAALLLHWPLTVYRAIQLATLESLMPKLSEELRIHYLGPEKELLQLAAFGELRALLPGIQVHINFVGPAIPEHRDGECISICTYAWCNQLDCHCKNSVDSEGIKSSDLPAIRIQLHAGCYHDCYKNLVKDSVPDIIIAPNAGLAAYTSWIPTLELMKEINVPVVFSDYCEEASHLAANCISSVTGSALKIPIQINPFRQPLRVEESALLLPCYSNCFLFGI